MNTSNQPASQFGRFLLYAAALAFFWFQVIPPAHAQSDASISGTVRDASGAGVAAAIVQIENIETGSLRDLETDSAGRFAAPSLAVGTYEITADKPGFRTNHRSGIVLVVGQHQELDLTLQVGDVHQTVEVSSEPNVLAATTEDTSGLVGERQVKDLPLNGRSYDQLLTLNPGAINYTSQRAGSTGTSNSELGNMFSVSGHRPQENLFLLNGVEYTGASEIGNTPGGVSGQLLGVDAVSEFAVLSDTYGAEYG
ncbi:MAG: carboxypeptidase-like regulatory domain-containing protein, partial [Candidatus Acidiferrum sp.]